MADNLIECERCYGTGNCPDMTTNKNETCPACGGTGKVSRLRGKVVIQSPPPPPQTEKEIRRAKSGGPAFPLDVAVDQSGDVVSSYYADTGMTLRQWYKGQALVSLAGRNFTLDERVIIASDLADAMIQEDTDNG